MQLGLNQSYKVIKLLIVGDKSSGKSSLLLRWCNNTFDQRINSTTCIDFKIKQIVVNEQQIKVRVWDTPDRSTLANISTNYYRNIDGILIVYDLSNSDSMNNIIKWLNFIKLYTDYPPIMLVGNKSDISTTVYDFNNLLKSEIIFDNIMVSAKTGANVDMCFATMINKIKVMEENWCNLSHPISCDIQSDDMKNKKYCCF